MSSSINKPASSPTIYPTEWAPFADEPTLDTAHLFNAVCSDILETPKYEAVSLEALANCAVEVLAQVNPLEDISVQEAISRSEGVVAAAIAEDGDGGGIFEEVDVRGDAEAGPKGRTPKAERLWRMMPNVIRYAVTWLAMVIRTLAALKTLAHHTAMDFLQVSEKVRGDLTLPDSEDTWERIAKALVSLKQSCETERFDDPRDVVQYIRSTYTSINHAMNSERTRLCLAALDLLDAVAIACGAICEPLIPIFFPALLSMCGRTNKVIINRTRSCIFHIIESTQMASVLPYCLAQMTEKAVTIRLICVEAALACIKCCNPPDLEKESRASEIESIIRKAARDASADVRKVGREIFGAYKILLPGRLDRFTAPLTPTIKKYLDIKASNGNAGKPQLPSVKSMTSSAASGSRLVIKQSRTTSGLSNSTSTSTLPKEPSRPARPPSRGDTLHKTTTMHAARVAASSRPDSGPDPSRRLVSRAGAAGPSRVIARPASTEPPRAVVRAQRPVPAPASKPLSRPVVASGSNPLNVSGPRRVPLPLSSSQSTQAAAKAAPPPRPLSQQSRRVPAIAKALERPGFAPVKRQAAPPIARPRTPVEPVEKAVERMPKVRAGLSQPTASQMAKMKPSIARKPSQPFKPVSKSKAAAEKPNAVLRDGGPRSNAKAKDVQAVKVVVADEVVEELSGKQDVVGETVPDAELQEQVTAEKEAEEEVEEEEQVAQVQTPVTCALEVEEVVTPVQGTQALPEVHVHESCPSPAASPAHGEVQREEDRTLNNVPQTQEIPVTPHHNQQLGATWNNNLDPKTPITALLASIQQGFEFSPASPLSPPQSYVSTHTAGALPLF